MGVCRAEVLLSSIVIKFLTKVGWLHCVCGLHGSNRNAPGYARLKPSVLCQRLVPTILVFLSVCLSYCPVLDSNFLSYTAQFNTGRTIRNLSRSPVEYCALSFRSWWVCGTLFCFRDHFSHCPILVSNFLSHTAQFSTRRKVWKHLCLLYNCIRFITDHDQSSRQTAGVFCSDRIPFSLGIAIRSPCRPCMSLCIRVACTQQRRIARGNATSRRGWSSGIVFWMEFYPIEILDGFRAPLRCNLKPFEIAFWMGIEPLEVVEVDLRFRWGATSNRLRLAFVWKLNHSKLLGWIWGSVEVQLQIVWDCFLNGIWTIWGCWDGFEVPLRRNLKSFEIVFWIEFRTFEVVDMDFEVPLRCNLKAFFICKQTIFIDLRSDPTWLL